jgi:hypothetical protein
MSDGEGGLIKWCFSLSDALLGHRRGGGFFFEYPKRYEDQGSGDGHFSPWGPHWDSTDHLGRGPFTEKSERSLQGGALTGNPEGYVEGGSVDRHLSTGALFGKLEGGSFTRDFERWVRQQSPSMGTLCGTWGGGVIYRECLEFVEGRLWLYIISLYGSCVNPSTPELNLSAQRCLKTFFTGDFAS